MIYQQTRLPQPFAQVAGGASQGLAYGGMRKTTDQVIGNLGATWVPINAYQSDTTPTTPGAVTNLANGTIQVARAGVYVLVSNIDTSYTADNNSSRRAALQIFNVSTGTAVPESVWDLYAGAYTAGFAQSVSAPFYFSRAGDLFRIEIAGQGSTFAAFTIKQASFFLYSLGSVV